MTSRHGARLVHGVQSVRHPNDWVARLTCVVATAACAPVEDVVFETNSTVSLANQDVSVPEDVGAVSLTLRLENPAPVPIWATYRLVGIEAQDNCQQADFSAAQGSVRWEAGQTESVVQLWVEDDDLAETDERFLVVVDEVVGATSSGTAQVEVTIEDDDREALLDAAEFGVSPNVATDQSAALQEALDAARDRGRGVVVLAPGDYLVTGVLVHAGTTLSGRRARLLRPAESGGDTITITASYGGSTDSEATLIEGVSVDGQRDLQGEYQGWELSNAHLVSTFGDIATPGRIRVSIQDVKVSSGTADGITVGPQSEAQLCNVLGHDLWRDAISLHGGGSSLSLRKLGATATVGTSGMWLDGDTPGFEETRHVDIELEDVSLSSGDLEVSLAQGSTMTLRRVTMDLSPFRLLAPDSTVEIQQSRIFLGLLGPPREDGALLPLNQWQIPHDVHVVDSTLVASESPPEYGEVLPEDTRTFALVEVVWAVEGIEVLEPNGHQLVFENCKFERDETSIEPDDTVFAVRSATDGGEVIIRSSSLDPGFAGWFAPNCSTCTEDE